VPDYFVKLTALDELHAEVALAILLAYLVNWNNTGMFQAGSGFSFPTKTLQVRFRGPRA
jgi:hypothetical protein